MKRIISVLIVIAVNVSSFANNALNRLTSTQTNTIGNGQYSQT
jgi:hypothetical protein